MTLFAEGFTSDSPVQGAVVNAFQAFHTFNDTGSGIEGVVPMIRVQANEVR